MLIKRSSDIPSSEITPPEIYARRREFLKAAAAAGVGAALGGGLMLGTRSPWPRWTPERRRKSPTCARAASRPMRRRPLGKT